MDFAQFDVREAADEGAFCQLVHPSTRTPLEDGDGQPVGFVVRGNASRKAQDALARARKTAKAKIETANDLHENEVKMALALIVEARNIDFGGKPVGSDRDLIKKVLDTTFPELRARDDDERAEGEDGGLDLLNRPFANQVLRFAARQDNFLGE